MPHDTTPSATRERSYNGGYMDAGREAEEIVISHFENSSGVLQYIDVRNDPLFQDREIDFTFLLKRDLPWKGLPPEFPHSVEVKSDQHVGDTGNWLFELQRINLTASPGKQFVQGWSIRSEAEWLFLLAAPARALHVIKFADYRKAFLNACQACKVDWHFTPTDQIKRTVNLLFPETFVHEMPSYKRLVLGE